MGWRTLAVVQGRRTGLGAGTTKQAMAKLPVAANQVERPPGGYWSQGRVRPRTFAQARTSGIPLVTEQTGPFEPDRRQSEIPTIVPPSGHRDRD